MIKGWKNDPRWGEYYDRKNKELFERMISRIENEQNIKRLQLEKNEFLEGILRKRGSYKVESLKFNMLPKYLSM